MSYSVLLVDDERLFIDSLKEFLNKKFDDVDCCYSFQEAQKKLHEKEYDVCVFDIVLPDGNGIDLLKVTENQDFSPEVILITAHDFSFNEKFNEIKEQVFDFVLKPINLNYALKRIDNAIEKRKKKIQDYYNLSQVSEKIQIVGVSSAIQNIKKMASFLANVDSHVLITGETGTGKELVAKYIHYNGFRANSPFVPVNCSAISPELFESEFFGHEKGAFSGALNTHKGLFEIAGDGTLFLDEIGELDLGFQSKLLRILETRDFRRVGGTKILKSKARILAATNRNLLEEIRKNSFRKDLYYRISVVTLEIPPLRERKEDVVPIALYLWDKICNKLRADVKKPSVEWFNKLKEYQWPGNVRELSNFLEKQIIMQMFSGKDDIVSLLENHYEQKNTFPSKIVPLKQLVNDYILYVYEKCDFNKTKTAKVLGISLSTLKRKLKNIVS